MTNDAEKGAEFSVPTEIDRITKELRYSGRSGRSYRRSLSETDVAMYSTLASDPVFIASTLESVRDQRHNQFPYRDDPFSVISLTKPDELSNAGRNLMRAVLNTPEETILSSFGEHAQDPGDALKFAMLILSHFPPEVITDVFSGKMTLEDVFELRRAYPYKRLIDIISPSELDSIVSYLKRWPRSAEELTWEILGPISTGADFIAERNRRAKLILHALSSLPERVVGEIMKNKRFGLRAPFGERLVLSYLLELDRMPISLRRKALLGEISFEAARNRAFPFTRGGQLRYHL